MGLLKGLLLLPLAPVQGVSWVADVVLDAAERELYDPAVVHARLAALNRAFDDGEIDAEHFAAEEERLLDLLDQRPLDAHRPGLGGMR
ncbi:gas vesicle protein GvpG [Actinacidiphila acididurans]|uniref:Gas vesicle protein GvpG n=1 Tax=Actinacidiphila acididurans TaxID=2784346 RepID=A0ABS2TX06_9ACTN|nr:gas vesicle protein GvpG [Actinacidiphila acididurans]MBM9507876.1 gas vesicle protein GvpG [Actinacidiphila acididurans]